MQSSADEGAIRDWFDRYVANNVAGGFAAFGDFWTEDVTWLPPEASVAQGREAILDYVRPLFQAYTVDQLFEVREVRTAGDLAFARVDFKERYTPKTHGEDPFDLSPKSIFLFQRQDDGEWLASHCVWNSSAPSPQ